MKEFTTAGAGKERPTAQFLLDGAELTARRPKSMALLELASLDKDSGPVAQVQAAKNFIDDCLTPPSRDYINGRLYDPEDEFEFDDLTPILEWVVEEFTRPPAPPAPPNGSSATHRRTGRPSTAAVRPSAPTPATSTADDS